jgi:transcriptional regulator with XRE-family HTH domain
VTESDLALEMTAERGMAEPVTGSVTVRRMLVGAHLRRLREEKGISRADAGFTIRASESKMSRLELGRVAFKERDVSDLLMLYGVTDPEQRDAVLALVREANRAGWWREYDDVMPGYFQNYVGLEEAATQLRTYETHFVPGLLQTPEYAGAVIEATGLKLSARDLERAVNLRIKRQGVLTRPNPLRVWAVIDEAALRREMGDQEIYRAQLEHLLELAELPNVALQVLPLRSGLHAAGGGAFNILRFSDADLPDVVYVEHLVSALYIEKIEHVERYTEVMDRLSVQSLTPEASTDLISKLLTEG